MNQGTITQLNRNQDFPDGKTEFEIKLRGPAQRCRIDYGDGTSEEVTLEPTQEEVTLYGEHAFPPGVYRVLVLLQQDNSVVARKILMVTKT